MKTVEDLAREIIAREGGFANDPADPGGPTNYGVTLTTPRRLGHDLTGDGRTDLADVKALTPDKAVAIYTEHYFRRPRLSELPETLQPAIFDMYVNAGANAVRLLQRLLIDLGHSLAEDGAVGPATIVAAKAAAQPDPVLLADAYGIARRNYYYRLADARPAMRKFARSNDGGKSGRVTRPSDFIPQRFHLTLAEHRERTARWA